MMRSMFSGVTGLRVHQTKMDVIANNIANVNTVGFKASRVTFSEAFNQTMSGASRANQSTGRGGVNPMQIGLGVNIGSISTVMEPGTAQRTDGAYDLMIEGDGFFVVGDASGRYFTRAGDFTFDRDGNMTNFSGMRVQGWKATTDAEGATTIERGQVRDITIGGNDNYMQPEMTSVINFDGNLNQSTDTMKESTIAFFDSLGNEYVVDTKYVYDTSAKAWQLYVGQFAFPNGDRKKGVQLNISTSNNPSSGSPTAGILDMKFELIADDNTILSEDGYIPIGSNMSYDTVNQEHVYDEAAFLKYDEHGKPILNGGYAGNPWATGDPILLGSLNISIDNTAGILNPDAAFSSSGISVRYKDTTQFGNTAETTMGGNTMNGNAAGTLTGLSIGSDGIISGRYSNGTSKMLAQVAIAQFKNPSGLEKVGGNLFVETANSGVFDGVGTVGNLMSGALEMSKVDLAYEFTEMITTQRGFQANSRIISTSDEMLQELVNLKR